MKILGIPVVFDPRCATLAVARGLWPFKRIAVGPEWYRLDVGERLGVLFHEAGHCVGLHMEKRLAAAPLLFIAPGFIRRFTHAQEIEADRFAADQGYALDLARVLESRPAPESLFYPSNEVRSAILRARHLQEASPC